MTTCKKHFAPIGSSGFCCQCEGERLAAVDRGKLTGPRKRRGFVLQPWGKETNNTETQAQKVVDSIDPSYYG